MARTTAPLLSMDASGSVGNSLTFAKWKGRNYVRRWAKPANPRSTAQVSIRTAMQLYTAIYKASPEAVEAAFAAEAASLKISPFNAYTRAGMKNWKSSILVFPNGNEVAMGTTDADISLTGTVQPRGITWEWSETDPLTPWAWLLTVRDGADPGLTTAYAVHGTATGTSWLQTGLQGATTYHARITMLTTTGVVLTKSAAVTATTP